MSAKLPTGGRMKGVTRTSSPGPSAPSRRRLRSSSGTSSRRVPSIEAGPPPRRRPAGPDPAAAPAPSWRGDAAADQALRPSSGRRVGASTPAGSACRPRSASARPSGSRRGSAPRPAPRPAIASRPRRTPRVQSTPSSSTRRAPPCREPSQDADAAPARLDDGRRAPRLRPLRPNRCGRHSLRDRRAAAGGWCGGGAAWPDSRPRGRPTRRNRPDARGATPRPSRSSPRWRRGAAASPVPSPARSALATSTGGSPARRGPIFTAIGWPTTRSAAATIWRLLKPVPLPRLQMSGSARAACRAGSRIGRVRGQERGQVCRGQVLDVDVVADAGAVGSGVVVAEERQLAALLGGSQDVGDQVRLGLVLLAVRSRWRRRR